MEKLLLSEYIRLRWIWTGNEMHIDIQGHLHICSIILTHVIFDFFSRTMFRKEKIAVIKMLISNRYRKEICINLSISGFT